jgi:hypothetical protein
VPPIVGSVVKTSFVVGERMSTTPLSPSTMSRPVPPAIVSLAAPPRIMSSPAKPSITSLPPVAPSIVNTCVATPAEVRRTHPPSPTITSRATPPVI